MLGEFLGNALRNSGYAHELAKVDKLFIRVALPFRKRCRRHPPLDRSCRATAAVSPMSQVRMGTDCFRSDMLTHAPKRFS